MKKEKSVKVNTWKCPCLPNGSVRSNTCMEKERLIEKCLGGVNLHSEFLGDVKGKVVYLFR